jgi:hypothetical protein
MNYTTDFKSIRDEVSASEWQTRLDLAACYRLIDCYDMSDMASNHITARIPDSDDHLLINLYGMTYREITASSLVKIDLEGNILWKPETDYSINKSGYVIHGAIHHARPDVRHGGFGDGVWTFAVIANGDAFSRPHRLSRLRGAFDRAR